MRARTAPEQKTYWHLLAARRLPTEYEIVSSRLLYYVENGFEVDVPLNGWYERYQRGSRLTCGDWETFQDPRETTYATYTKVRSAREAFLDHLIEAGERTGALGRLSGAWIGLLDRLLPPLLHPCHGFQMIASYTGTMSPSGRIAIACLFQAADEIRRIERVAYRVRQIQLARAGFGEAARRTWQEDPVWQPLREVVEKLLVTYDWGESFVALNLVVKPLVDELWASHVRALAASQGDEALAGILFSLGEDESWHREWAMALVRTAVDDDPGNGEVVREWIEKWRPRSLRAVEPLVSAFGEMPGGERGWARRVMDALRGSHGDLLHRAGTAPAAHDSSPKPAGELSARARTPTEVDGVEPSLSGSKSGAP